LIHAFTCSPDEIRDQIFLTPDYVQAPTGLQSKRETQMGDAHDHTSRG
jgi:hypothetical protein